jgi:hypothetical protein
MWDPTPSREQFLMWGLEAAAFGSSALMFWSGNRWRGGHWPHWGGLLDWSGHPEADFDWAVELGGFYKNWGRTLLANPVKATAAILTDFNNRSALEVYPHVPDSVSVVPDSFDALHRLGIGVDSLTTARVCESRALRAYSCIILPAATSFDDAQATAALRGWVEGGGVLIITPFTSYIDKDGIFRSDGFASNLKPLTGVLVRTVRWMGSPSTNGAPEPKVAWSERGISEPSPVGLNGYVEYLELEPHVEIIAAYQSDQQVLSGRPAATRNRLGNGTVIKLGFWPADDSFLSLVSSLVSNPVDVLAGAAPQGVLAVPRTDDSLFLVNTTRKEQRIQLKNERKDRISHRSIHPATQMKPFEVIWLER